ncbi:ogr/Delta-like zinc finger family protein [Enterobacter sp. PTB]|uniref:ogr/Delta-like zinc finger family protein n=1 Tax=Enterobacter sp. PTB TaxID=3143437 RepID=UPI003DAA3521
MFKCPECRTASKTRTSEYLSNAVQRSYHQCQNLQCGLTFCTLTEVTHTLNRGETSKLRSDTCSSDRT